MFLAAAAGSAACTEPVAAPEAEIPAHLDAFRDGRSTEPSGAARAWFRSAACGLFLEYGVYSQLRRGPSVQFDERIPVARYAELNRTFDPGGFDAERLAGLAVECGMKYVGLPARHADGFCLFRTVETEFNSLESSGRDLVGELSESCSRSGIGLVLSYSYAADWRHPYFFPAETAWTDWRGARPAYAELQPEYRFETDEDFLYYVRYAHGQLQEIAYRYDALAGIRLEPLAGYRARPDLFPVEQTYAVLREARPAGLVSFGPGASGGEDFVSVDGAATGTRIETGGRPLEIGRPLRVPGAEGPPDAQDLLATLREASSRDANLLLRVPLLPDGSLDPADERALLEFGGLRRSQPAA